ncbi:hypothetical protein Dimus_036284, partial [Dionaea muscipula]
GLSSPFCIRRRRGHLSPATCSPTASTAFAGDGVRFTRTRSLRRPWFAIAKADCRLPFLIVLAIDAEVAAVDARPVIGRDSLSIAGQSPSQRRCSTVRGPRRWRSTLIAFEVSADGLPGEKTESAGDAAVGT